jgi:ATP-dependent phosphofructokinase / diphosphate-dependent phosphofructokinase
MVRIGILTGGGDCPGLNAVIRAAVLKGTEAYGFEFVGFRNGWKGPMEGVTMPLDAESVRGILGQGGTILGSSRTNPVKMDGGIDAIRRTMSDLGVDALLVIGGEDTLGVATRLHTEGIKVVGAPKTIDNDLSATDYTFGFDTAVQIAVDACDRLRTTGASHHRAMIVEVMGRHAGWIALHTGMAASAAVTLIPEVRYDLDEVAATVRGVLERGEAPLIVIAEGAVPAGGDVVHTGAEKDAFGHVQLKGVGEVLERGLMQRLPDLATRVTVLGHLLRGGTPTAYDRILGTRSGLSAVTAIAEGNFGTMAALRGTEIVQVPLADATGELKTVGKQRLEELAWVSG